VRHEGDPHVCYTTGSTAATTAASPDLVTITGGASTGRAVTSSATERLDSRPRPDDQGPVSPCPAALSRRTAAPTPCNSPRWDIRCGTKCSIYAGPTRRRLFNVGTRRAGGGSLWRTGTDAKGRRAPTLLNSSGKVLTLRGAQDIERGQRGSIPGVAETRPLPPAARVSVPEYVSCRPDTRRVAKCGTYCQARCNQGKSERSRARTRRLPFPSHARRVAPSALPPPHHDSPLDRCSCL
jgi:hypothetical protein